MSPQLVHEIGDAIPPQQCAGKDKGESEHEMIDHEIGIRKTEAGEKSHDQNHDEGIGKSEKIARDGRSAQ